MFEAGAAGVALGVVLYDGGNVVFFFSEVIVL